MELNWTTFALEILNFLVLVWILKHFLYAPVLSVIERRRAAIVQQEDETSQRQKEAESLQAQYQGRVAHWEREREQAREKLKAELDVERTQRHEKLELELAAERQRVSVAEQKQREDAECRIEVQAMGHAARFAARLLQVGACEAMHQQLLALFMTEVAALPEASLQRLRHPLGDQTASVQVLSAYELTRAQQQQLQQSLQTVLPEHGEIIWRVDETLLAGIRVAVGAWELGANLKDELQGFAEFCQHE